MRGVRRAAGAAVVVVLLVAGCSGDAGHGYDESAASPGLGSTYSSSAALFVSRDPVADSPVPYFTAVDAQIAAQSPIVSDGRPFEVVEFGPEGLLPTEVRRPTVFVVFSQPVVPLTQLGSTMRENALMSISPELPGTFRWMGSRILSFQPDEPMNAQLEYVVEIAGDTPALTGQIMEQAFQFSFFREPLSMVHMYPGSPDSDVVINPEDAHPDEVSEITVEFSYPVDIEFIQQFLQIRVSEHPEPVPFSVRRPSGMEDDSNRRERTVVLQLQKQLPADHSVGVDLLPGARSRPEYRGTDELSTQWFHTIKPFAYQSMQTYSYYQTQSSAADSNPVFLRFSHPLSQQDWNEALNISLPIDDISPYVELYGNTLRLNNLPVEYESTYTIEIRSSLRDVYGRPLDNMPRGRSRVVQKLEIEVPRAARYFHTPNRGSRLLEAQFTPRILFELQNPDSGVWRIDRIDDPFESFSPSTLEPYNLDHIQPNTKHFEVVELEDYLNEEGFGSVGVAWNFAPRLDDGRIDSRRQVNLQLQVTDLGITTRYAHNTVLVWVNSLTDGAPVANADVVLSGYHSSGAHAVSAATDSNGLAVLELADGQYGRELVDAYGADRLQIEVTYNQDRVVFRPAGNHNAYRSGVYNQIAPGKVHEGRAVPFLFTDRGLYRPGEDVSYRIIDRNLVLGEYEAYSGAFQMAIRENRWRSESIWSQQGVASEFGGAGGSFSLPEDIEPGDYLIEYSRPGLPYPHQVPFQVAYFRRAAFAVQVTAPPQEVFAGDRLNFTVAADYLSGGGVGGGELSYVWRRMPVRFAPSGTRWRGYGFGPRRIGESRVVHRGGEVLDSSGRASVGLRIAADEDYGIAYNYLLEARVQDPASQELAGRGVSLMHPAEYYLGVRLSSGNQDWTTFTRAGQATEAAIAAVLPNGELHSSSRLVEVEWIRRSWQSAQQRGLGGRLNTRYEAVEEVVFAEQVVLRGGQANAAFTPDEAGRYVLRVSSLDSNGRRAVSEMSFYAAGSQWVRWLANQPDEIRLIPDKESYEVGDTARLFVQSPIADGRYLLTLEREGILEHSWVNSEGSGEILEIPITEQHVPVLYVALSAASQRAEPPESYFEPDLGKPRGFFGITALEVSPSVRKLDVDIATDQAVYSPGSTAEVQVRVTREGQPVAGAEVVLLGVDRGVLDLIDYRVPDPVSYFYSSEHFPLGVRGADSRGLLVDPVTYEIKDLQGGGGEGDKLDERADFRPLAVFEPFLVTDENGVVTVAFDWPDTLTTYRLTAIAVETARFGKQEYETQVQNPLTVRTALPKQLRVRDSASAGVVLTNLADSVQQVEITLHSEGGQLPTHNSQLIELLPGHTREARFLLHFDEPGEVDLVFSVRSELVQERLRDTLTIVEPRVGEAFTLAGSLRDGAIEEALVLPQAVLPGSGEIELRLSSVLLDHLRQPFARWINIDDDRSIEMLVYRAIPYAVLGENLSFILADEAVALAQRHVQWLQNNAAAYQHNDGGFVFQSNQRRSSHPSPPRTTILVAEAIVLLQQSEMAVENLDREALLTRLRDITSDDRVPGFERSWALLLLSQLDPAGGYRSELSAVAELEDDLSVAGYGLLTTAAANLRQPLVSRRAFDRLRNVLQIGTQSVDFVETSATKSYFDSSVLRLAAVYQAYAVQDADSAVPARLRMAIHSAALNSPWINSLDTLWAAKVAAASLGGEAVFDSADFSSAIAGHELLSQQVDGLEQRPFSRRFRLDEPPFSELAPGQVHPLRIAVGTDRELFYSATLSYDLPPEVITARDEGFSIFRHIEDLAGNAVSFEELKRGTTYRISVTIGTDRNRFASYLRVPVPSGMDILDGSLSMTSSYDETGGVSGRSWVRETGYGDTKEYSAEGVARYSHSGWVFYQFEPERRLYPGEVTYHFPQLYPGSQTVSFLARAVIPGVYPVLPAVIEVEGQEEVFGRTDGTLGIIE